MEPEPATYELRPLDLGEIMDRALGIYLHHWKPLLALTLGIVVPLSIPSTMLRTAGGSPMEQTAGAVLAMGIDVFVVSGLLGAVLVLAISELYLHGTVSAPRALRRGATYVFGIILIALAVTLATFAGALACIVPGLYLSAALFASQIAYVLEGRGIGEAMERSWELTRGSRWRVLGCMLVFQMIAGFAGFAIGLGMHFLGGALDLPMFASQFAAQVLSAFIVPFPSIGLVLLYYDLRVRREAFDVQMLARELGGGPAPSP